MRTNALLICSLISSAIISWDDCIWDGRFQMWSVCPSAFVGSRICFLSLSFLRKGLVQNPRVYFVVLMSVCPSIFTTDSIEILLASATVANVCLAIKWCYKINFELCKKEKVFKTEDLLWWSAWDLNLIYKSLIINSV